MEVSIKISINKGKITRPDTVKRGIRRKLTTVSTVKNIILSLVQIVKTTVMLTISKIIRRIIFTSRTIIRITSGPVLTSPEEIFTIIIRLSRTRIFIRKVPLRIVLSFREATIAPRMKFRSKEITPMVISTSTLTPR